MGRDAFTPSWRLEEARSSIFLESPKSALKGDFRGPFERLMGKAPKGISKALFASLSEQEAKRKQSESRTRNLQRLGDGARVVITGQQVGLFLGPLYALHKAATAIVLAQKLEKAWEQPVVPLYWLQSEDADFEEVKSTAFPGLNGVEELSMGPSRSLSGKPLDGESRCSLSHRLLGDEINRVFSQLESLLGGPYKKETLALLQAAYQENKSWAEAAGELMAELFQDHGLLVFDPRPRDAEHLPFASDEAQALLRFSLQEHQAIEATLQAREAALDEADYTVQVPIREGVNLLSVHLDGEDGDRYRLCPEGNDLWGLSGADKQFSTGELEALFQRPYELSTTALLRPLVQDSLFPTVAYVGGPGEIAYFSQLSSLYELAKVPMPVIVERAHIFLSSPASRRLMEQLGLPAEAWAYSEENLRETLTTQQLGLEDVEALEKAWSKDTESLILAITDKAEVLGDKEFSKHGDKTQDQVMRAMERLLDRLKRLGLQRDEEGRAKLERLLGFIKPLQNLQERVLSLPYFAAQVGPQALAGSILEAIEASWDTVSEGQMFEVAL